MKNTKSITSNQKIIVLLSLLDSAIKTNSEERIRVYKNELNKTLSTSNYSKSINN